VRCHHDLDGRSFLFPYQRNKENKALEAGARRWRKHPPQSGAEKLCMEVGGNKDEQLKRSSNETREGCD